MKKWWLVFLFIPSFWGFVEQSKNKALDLNAFKITIPHNWVYKKVQGEDSFVGMILTKSSGLHFDFSMHGYANSLIQTEQEYLKAGMWLMDCPFCKPGITYTASFDVKKEKLRMMKEKGIIDSTLVKVEAFPDPKIIDIHQVTQSEKLKYPKADYISTLTYKDSTILFPIKLPVEIRKHNIRIDTTGKYLIKTIWPKTIGSGMTGIYFQGLKNHLTFNLVARDLNKEEQEQALTAFKTIIINEK